jgi:hypothetical protein
VDTADGAAVRIAMTTGIAGSHPGRLLVVATESDTGQDEVAVTFREQTGVIHADLNIGIDLSKAILLHSNQGLCNVGVIPHGEGFVIPHDQANRFEAGLLRKFRNGKDIVGSRSRDVRLIDTNELSLNDLRSGYPATYQWLLDRVKPDRDQNPRATRRINWWLFGENHPRMRRSIAGLSRYIVTVLTSKHRTFVFLNGDIVPDQTLVVIGSDSSFHLAILSSSVHLIWALAAGSRLGVGNDPRYNKVRCFEPFPFPAATEEQQARIRALGEQLDAHRKRQQAAHPDLTLTGMYNVLEKLRAGETLTAKERTLHEHGLVSVLRQLHDELDAAVLGAYGWSDLLPLLQVAHGNAVAPAQAGARSGSRSDKEMDSGQRRNDEPKVLPEGEGKADAKRAFDEAILERLVALNAERAAEEARGVVRWLRPAFQHPETEAVPTQAEIETGAEAIADVTAAGVAKPQAWPSDAIAQVRAVADALTTSAAPLSVDDITARFKARGSWKKRVPALLDMLVALGRAQEKDGRFRAMP